MCFEWGVLRFLKIYVSFDVQRRGMKLRLTVPRLRILQPLALSPHTFVAKNLIIQR
jgi:hypothetical protein